MAPLLWIPLLALLESVPIHKGIIGKMKKPVCICICSEMHIISDMIVICYPAPSGLQENGCLQLLYNIDSSVPVVCGCMMYQLCNA